MGVFYFISLLIYIFLYNDKLKLDLLKKNDYNFEVIWESDYKKNNNIIKEIIKKWEN